MQKGAKTSEFYIVLAVIAPWVSQQLGFDISSILANPDDLAGMIKAAHDQGGNAPVWVAAIYCAGRFLLKWGAAK